MAAGGSVSTTRPKEATYLIERKGTYLRRPPRESSASSSFNNLLIYSIPPYHHNHRHRHRHRIPRPHPPSAYAVAILNPAIYGHVLPSLQEMPGSHSLRRRSLSFVLVSLGGSYQARSILRSATLEKSRLFQSQNHNRPWLTLPWTMAWKAMPAHAMPCYPARLEP